MSVRAAGEVLGDVTAELEQVFADLEHLGAAFAALDARPLRRADVETLRPAILALLSAPEYLVSGAGVVTAPGLLADAPRWLEWWWTSDRGAPEPLRVNLDPAAPDFYDYTTSAWFTARTACMTGPYVDYACTNEYAITLSVPVDRLGVAAADVLVTSLERRVLPALLALERPTALTNADGRVIASSDPALAPGLRIDVRGAGWLLVESPVS
jgi:hypothetical protein